MKKNEVKKLTEAKKIKKLRLSQETLHVLTSSDAQKVVGGDGDQDRCPSMTGTWGDPVGCSS